MRQIVFVVAVLTIFGSLARLVWVESEILAEGYEIQRLRTLEGRNQNDIRMFELSIEKRLPQPKMEELADAYGFSLGAVRVLPRREWPSTKAAH